MEDGHRRGHEREQAPEAAPRLRQRVRFERLGDREQERETGRLAELAEQHGPGSHDRHQCADADLAAGEGAH